MNIYLNDNQVEIIKNALKQLDQNSVHDLIETFDYVFDPVDFSTDITEVDNVQYQLQFLVCYDDETWFTEGYLFVNGRVPKARLEQLAIYYWEEFVLINSTLGLVVMEVILYHIESDPSRFVLDS